MNSNTYFFFSVSFSKFSVQLFKNNHIKSSVMQLFRRVLDCAPYSCFLFKKWLHQGQFPGGIISNKKSVMDSYFGSNLQHNGHILIDSPMTRRQNSTGNVRVRGNYSNFEGRIHVEIMTSIQRGNFEVVSAFKVDKISNEFSTWIFLLRFDLKLM